MRRRALLAAITAGIGGLAGCNGGGDSTPTPTTSPTSTPTTGGTSPTATPTETRTAARTVAPETRRRIVDRLSTAALKFDEQIRMPTLTDQERSFDTGAVETPLDDARAAIEEVPADRRDALGSLVTVADALRRGVDAATSYAEAVGLVREALTRHSLERFEDAAGRFEAAADPVSTAVAARDDAAETLRPVNAGTVDVSNYNRLESALVYLDGALTGLEPVVAGGPPLERGIETFGLGEEWFANDRYESAETVYTDAAASLQDAVDGFASDASLDDVPEHVRSTLDTHRCRAAAYHSAADLMTVAARKWETDRVEAGSAYDDARTELGRDCVALDWGDPAES